MAPNSEHLRYNSSINKPSKLSMESLQRTISDISLQLSNEQIIDNTTPTLPPISEVENVAKCECCGMSEECTQEYIKLVREKYSGKLVCGLCTEAVNQEMEKNGGKREEALNEHMSVCVRFNKFGRTHPVLYQAEAMREILKKSSRIRAKSMSPRDKLVTGQNSKKATVVVAVVLLGVRVAFQRSLRRASTLNIANQLTKSIIILFSMELKSFT